MGTILIEFYFIFINSVLFYRETISCFPYFSILAIIFMSWNLKDFISMKIYDKVNKLYFFFWLDPRKNQNRSKSGYYLHEKANLIQMAYGDRCIQKLHPNYKVNIVFCRMEILSSFCHIFGMNLYEISIILMSCTIFYLTLYILAYL